jgi:hypothetical protein
MHGVEAKVDGTMLLAALVTLGQRCVVSESGRETW